MFLLLPRLPLCLLHEVHVSAAVICPGLAQLGELLFAMDSPRLCVKGCVPLLVSSAALEPGTWGFISKVKKSSVLLGCSCFFKPLSWRKVLRCWESFPPRSFALEMQRTPRISGFGTEEQKIFTPENIYSIPAVAGLERVCPGALDFAFPSACPRLYQEKKPEEGCPPPPCPPPPSVLILHPRQLLVLRSLLTKLLLLRLVGRSEKLLECQAQRRRQERSGAVSS